MPILRQPSHSVFSKLPILCVQAQDSACFTRRQELGEGISKLPIVYIVNANSAC